MKQCWIFLPDICGLDILRCIMNGLRWSQGHGTFFIRLIIARKRQNGSRTLWITLHWKTCRWCICAEVSSHLRGKVVNKTKWSDERWNNALCPRTFTLYIFQYFFPTSISQFSARAAACEQSCNKLNITRDLISHLYHQCWEVLRQHRNETRSEAEADSSEVVVGGCRLRRRGNKGLQRKGDGDCGVVSMK